MEVTMYKCNYCKKLITQGSVTEFAMTNQFPVDPNPYIAWTMANHSDNMVLHICSDCRNKLTSEVIGDELPK